MNQDGNIDGDVRQIHNSLLKQNCCRKAFIRGAFLAAGSVSDPEKSYHFEIVCNGQEKAEELRSLLTAYEIDAKIVMRKKHYVVYVKEGSQIVELLGLTGAHVSLMQLENVRIVKEMRNSVNRKVNCETANLNKDGFRSGSTGGRYSFHPTDNRTAGPKRESWRDGQAQTGASGCQLKRVGKYAGSASRKIRSKSSPSQTELNC